jgi:CDP-diacylglycerol--glycerol-3-phosphate 3-phosphatidyltransferase
MLNIPNFLSFLRMPLALIFLQNDPIYRVLAIFFAMLTDFLDGYIARRYNLVNRVGTVLDPITDKFFVFFVLAVLVRESRLDVWEACILMCRDFSVILYGCYLALKNRLANYKFRAIWCGKITTVLQFIVLIALTLNSSFPRSLYGVFLMLGILALGELYVTDRYLSGKQKNPS